MVLLSGLLNFRDVGGVPVTGGGRVRTGVLYRSASPARFNSAARAALAEMGLRTVVDLRDPVEVEYSPYTLDGSIAMVNVAVLRGGPVPQQQAELYAHMVERCGPHFARAMGALAHALPNPVLAHCAVGKDRTGVLVALALAAVGVSEEHIVADFLRSNAGLSIPEPAAAPVSDDDQYHTHHYVGAELIADALARVRGLGGDAGGYLTGHGLPAADVDHLRACLVEP
jgi:protein-tyrosine phosphatase